MAFWQARQLSSIRKHAATLALCDGSALQACSSNLASGAPTPEWVVVVPTQQAVEPTAFLKMQIICTLCECQMDCGSDSCPLHKPMTLLAWREGAGPAHMLLPCGLLSLARR